MYDKSFDILDRGAKVVLIGHINNIPYLYNEIIQNNQKAYPETNVNLIKGTELEYLSQWFSIISDVLRIQSLKLLREGMREELQSNIEEKLKE